MFKSCVFIISFIFLIACPSTRSNDEYYENESSRLRRSSDRSSSTPIRCSESRNNNVTVTEADDITSRNAGAYEISGRCSSNQGDVELDIAGGQKNVLCSGNRWRDFVDVTSVVQGREEVQISVRNGDDSACSVVKNFFQCPEGYAPVPRLTDDRDIDSNYDFCVMIYEARSETNRRSSYRTRDSSFRDRRETQRDQEEVRREYNERAVSKSGDDPWVDISRGEAERRCGNNGSGYKLITNTEWQIIARNIELEPSNWSLGHDDIEAGNYLNRGLLSLGNRRDSGYSRGGGSSSRWEDSKRTHILPNGEELWDISGGVWEMVADTVSTLERQGMESTNQRYIYELTDDNKKLFGPKRDYSSVGRSRGSVYNQGSSNVGLGGARLSNFNDIVVRGGDSENDGGIFAVDASIRSEGYNIGGGIGFRCVYNP